MPPAAEVRARGTKEHSAAGLDLCLDHLLPP
jgi:hypothetical protein